MDRDAKIALYTGLGLVGAILLAWPVEVAAGTPQWIPPPPSPPMPEAPSAPGVATWQIMNSPTTLEPGVRYRGCLSVPWPFSPGVDTVTERAKAEGFTDVFVATERPAGWPDVSCKHFIEATYAGAPRQLDIPGVMKFAWSLT